MGEFDLDLRTTSVQATGTEAGPDSITFWTCFATCMNTCAYTCGTVTIAYECPRCAG
ncbi:hypothetical protein [Micromonospora sp. NPDC002717]|uniref:hypothetical protein n=1 Tax=Micromonospora sp. NPDC002717 TaxID=3154424 RepID=UPI00332B06C3